MIRLLILLFSFISTTVLAQGRPSVTPPRSQVTVKTSSARLYFLNPEMRYERDGSQDLKAHSFFSFAAGFARPKYSLLLETSTFSEDSGNATSSIERTHRETVIWGRYHFYRMTLNSKFEAVLYGGVGAGMYEEKIKTRLSGVEREDQGGIKFMSGLVGGAEGTYPAFSQVSLAVALELRMLTANDFTPNPLWAGALRLGLVYPF